MPFATLESHTQKLHLHCDEEKENTPKRIPQAPTSRDPEFFPNVTSGEPHKITQKEISDLSRDLELSRNKAELLSSRLHQCSLPDNIVKVTAFDSNKNIFSISSRHKVKSVIVRTSRV